MVERSGVEPSGGSPLVILGIDPGSRHTGWGVIERRGSRLEVRGHGRISLPGSMALAERLARLGDAVSELVDEHCPHVAVLEALFHGVNPKSLIVLAQARGAILASLCRCRLDVREYSPAEVKSSVTGNGRADKQQVAKMVAMVLGLRGRKLAPDASDALAVAICYGQRARIDRLAGGRAEPRYGGGGARRRSSAKSGKNR